MDHILPTVLLRYVKPQTYPFSQSSFSITHFPPLRARHVIVGVGTSSGGEPPYLASIPSKARHTLHSLASRNHRPSARPTRTLHLPRPELVKRRTNTIQLHRQVSILATSLHGTAYCITPDGSVWSDPLTTCGWGQRSSMSVGSPPVCT